MKLYIPPQVTRLALAFAVFISLFLVLRHFLVPDSFGKYGPYRADALGDNALLEIHYAGQQACFECHQDVQDLKDQDVHSEIHCETCHGPGQKHVVSSGTEDILEPSGREFCGICHSANAAKNKNTIFQVNMKEHNIDKDCLECHNAHQPWEMKN